MFTAFPSIYEDDLEDVAWGLTTGEALWKQGERLDALVWLRRAASSAREGGQSVRAAQLQEAASALMALLEAGDLDSASMPAAAPEEASSSEEEVSRREKESSDIDELLAEPDRESISSFGDDDEAPTIHKVLSVPATDADVAPSRPPLVTQEIDEADLEEAPPSLSVVSAPPPTFSLDEIAAFADLPDDARLRFRDAARVETLAADEEVPLVGLALVIDGWASVQATVAESTAARVEAGGIVYAKGSLPDPISLRVVAGEETATLAIWEPDVVAEHLRSCPWVLEELRDSADRLQALAGTTVGPLGERLDEALRTLATERLTVRVFLAGETMAKQGEAVAGMMIVGGGAVELESNGQPGDTLGMGDFLFSTEVLGAGRAPATARAGPRGALILFGDRQLAHELLVTCPPLLEIFAGM